MPLSEAHLGVRSCFSLEVVAAAAAVAVALAANLIQNDDFELSGLVNAEAM